MSESECTIEDCPGCIMDDTVDRLKAIGLEPEDILMLFLQVAREKFPGHFVIEDIELATGSIH